MGTFPWKGLNKQISSNSATCWVSFQLSHSRLSLFHSTIVVRGSALRRQQQCHQPSLLSLSEPQWGLLPCTLLMVLITPSIWSKLVPLFLCSIFITDFRTLFVFDLRPLLPLSVTYFTQCTLYNVQTSAFLDSFPMIALLTVKCINNYIALHFWNVYKSTYFWFVRVYLASIFALWKDDGFMCGVGGRWGEW